MIDAHYNVMLTVCRGRPFLMENKE